MSAADTDRVTADWVVAEHDPRSVPIPQFLGACFDAGLSWVHFPEGLANWSSAPPPRTPRASQPEFRSERQPETTVIQQVSRYAVIYGCAPFCLPAKFPDPQTGLCLPVPPPPLPSPAGVTAGQYTSRR